MCSCRLVHIPTGIIKTAQTRSRVSSHKLALDALIFDLNNRMRDGLREKVSTDRVTQRGNGSNSNVIRTYCFQHGFVKNDTGDKISIDQFRKGYLDLLW